MTVKTNICFDFYIISLTSDEFQYLKEIFVKIVNNELSNKCTVKGFNREIFKLTELSDKNCWIGQFRKYRIDQLPVFASYGNDEVEITLKDDEGLVERNCFAYFSNRNLLIWQVDKHANHPDRFTEFLELITNSKVEALPIATKESLNKFMRNGVEILNFDIAVARPTAPSLYDENKFTKDIFDLMAHTGGDRFSLQGGVNLRKKEHGVLSNMKAGIKTLIQSGAATKAQFTISDLGERNVIDLILDKVSSRRQMMSSKKSIPFQTMVELIQSVYEEKQEVLNEILGEVQNTLL